MDQIVVAAIAVFLIVVALVALKVWAGAPTWDEAPARPATPEDEGRWLRD
jgi:hypothetical protein